MRTKEVVLLVLQAYGGVVAGRTMLQKVCYFADVALGLDLRFKAHYYGPYSPLVEQAVEELKGLGFVSENRIGFGVESPSGFGELRRYDYRLTDDGLAVIRELERRNPDRARQIIELAEEIRESGNPDYFILSLAAKSHFILTTRGRAMTQAEIREEAKRFDWRLRAAEIDRALALLRRLNLVEDVG